MKLSSMGKSDYFKTHLITELSEFLLSWLNTQKPPVDATAMGPVAQHKFSVGLSSESIFKLMTRRYFQEGIDFSSMQSLFSS